MLLTQALVSERLEFNGKCLNGDASEHENCQNLPVQFITWSGKTRKMYYFWLSCIHNHLSGL